jgi:hypothetical protein
MNTLDIEKQLEDIEDELRARRCDPPLAQRAGRIFRVKIYLMFGEGERYSIRNIIDLADSLPAEVKIVLSFIASLPALGMLMAATQAIRQLTPGTLASPIPLFASAAGFVATTATIVLYAVIVYLAFLAMNRLADRYFKKPEREP